MKKRILLRTFLKFLMWGSIFFFLWVFVGKPIYLNFIGWLISKVPFKYGKIQFIGLRENELIFRIFSMRADVGIDASGIVVYFVPYWALMLASPGSLRGRGFAIVYGTILLMLLQIVALMVILYMTMSGSIFLETLKIFIDAILLPIAPIILWFIFVETKSLKELINL